MPSAFDLGTSLLASSFRAWRGSASFRPAERQPEQLLELYDMEASPYCRLVRETLTELELDAMILPCPAGGTRFRPRVQELTGKQQFPYLVDPNTGDALFESAQIINHLHRTYGRGKTAPRGIPRSLSLAGSYAATASRAIGRVRGMRARPSRAPEQPLELYSFESSPYSRPVRERMTELELPYVLRNFGKACWEDMGPPLVRNRFFPDTPVRGRNRLAMREATGRSQVPYLVDANTGVSLYESDAIIRYLEQTYAL